MDEVIFYNAGGDPKDKKHDTAFAYLTSVHTTKQYQQYRTCPSNLNGACNLSIGNGSHTITALPDKPLINVYLYGKETPEQRIPIPEVMSSLAIFNDPKTDLPTYLLGGSVSGRLYIWSLNSGLLLSVKQPHYQALTHIVCKSGFVATGSKDSRVVVQTMVSLLITSGGKPFAILTDHTLPISSLMFNQGFNNDLKLYSSSLDSTVRVFSLTLETAKLVTTFVSTHPVTSLTSDPAFRCLYFGMDNGLIRIVPLFKTNPKTHIFEAVGGLGKIVTIKEDFDLLETITCHQDASVTQMKISFDGTLLISGDSKGHVFIIDISTKQISRKLKDINGPISNLEIWRIKLNDERFERKVGVDKSLVRQIPTLKRNICEEADLQNEKLIVKFSDNVLKESKKHEFNFDSWLDQVKEEEMVFTNTTNVDSDIITEHNGSGSSVVIGANAEQVKSMKKQLKEKNDELSALRAKYDELLKEYSDAVTK